MASADTGDRLPFFEGFSSWAAYRDAVRRLEALLARVAAGETADTRERDERLVCDFSSQRAFRRAVRRLEVELMQQSARARACPRWCPRTTVAERN